MLFILFLILFFVYNIIIIFQNYSQFFNINYFLQCVNKLLFFIFIEMCNYYYNYLLNILQGVNYIFIFLQFFSIYKDFLNNNSNSNTSSNNEINELKEKLNKANKIIESQNIKIKELENQLNNRNNINNNSSLIIEQLKNELKQKVDQINELKIKLENNNKNNVIMVDQNQIVTINFTSIDQKVHFATSCLKSTVFAEVEEKLYKLYPEYRETNNTFIANGRTILRFKTIDDNKIGNGLPIMLVQPTN